MTNARQLISADGVGPRAVASSAAPPLPPWVGRALALWVALLGADRIDLAGGYAPIVLTPFYVLTPLVIVGGWTAARRALTAEVPTLRPYTALVAALLALAALSIVRSADVTTSLGRLALLSAMSVGALLVAQLALTVPGGLAAIARGARLGLALAGTFGLIELLAFLQVLPDLWTVGTVTIRLDTAPYAGIVPRLSGLTSDANRAGLTTLIHLALILRTDARPSSRRGWTRLAGLLILLTLSRSAVVAALIAGAYARLRRAHRIAWTAAALPTGLLLLTIATVGLTQPRWFRSSVRYLEPLAGRLTLEEGSAQDHLHLVERGVTVATRSVPRTLLGTGYGTSFLLLRDRFGANRYGNFHSLYLTLWVESGVFALALMLLLLLQGIRHGVAWRGPLLGILGFNFFYQSHVDPAFWLLLAVAWLDSATEASVD